MPDCKTGDRGSTTTTVTMLSPLLIVFFLNFMLFHAMTFLLIGADLIIHSICKLSHFFSSDLCSDTLVLGHVFMLSSNFPGTTKNWLLDSVGWSRTHGRGSKLFTYTFPYLYDEVCLDCAFNSSIVSIIPVKILSLISIGVLPFRLRYLALVFFLWNLYWCMGYL